MSIGTGGNGRDIVGYRQLFLRQDSVEPEGGLPRLQRPDRPNLKAKAQRAAENPKSILKQEVLQISASQIVQHAL